MNASELTDRLGLHSLRNRQWYIQSACATSGDGLYEGLEWVSPDFFFPENASGWFCDRVNAFLHDSSRPICVQRTRETLPGYWLEQTWAFCRRSVDMYDNFMKIQ